MANGDSSRISVSEDTMRRILAEFKLELFRELKNYATASSVAELGTRIALVERDGSIGTHDELRDHENRLRSVENMKAQMRGVIITLVFLVTTIATMSWHVWS